MKYTVPVFFTLFSMMTVGLFAQETEPMRGPAAKIEQLKKVKMLEALHLNEDVSARFITRYSKHLDDIKEVNQKRIDYIDHLQDLLKNNGAEKEINSTIGNITDCENKIAEIRVKFVEGLKDVLTTNQIAEYIIFERNFNRNLREMIRDITRERTGRWQR